jgi:hypothetical protein
MIIAKRVLKLRGQQGDVEIPIRIFAPQRKDGDWSCQIEIGWPEAKLTRIAVGVDAIQALELALKMIGAQIYASNHHESGMLEWLEPGKGYGFPVPNGIRDLLVGDDKKYL